MPRKKEQVQRILVGTIPVFTKKLMIVDPACLESFVVDEPSKIKLRRDFSLSGACAATRTTRRVGELKDGAGNPVAVVAASPKNNDYPVYALVRGKKVLRLVIVFDEDPCREAPRKARSKKRA